MVGSNKILTVSYGTFSCKLEGFDQSFDTMKSIAEYFRDLAADDRYFGAEPPTPDADMLARIAEREIERRVEAHMESSGIVLRPAAALAAERAEKMQTAEAAQPTEAPAPEAAPTAEEPASPEVSNVPETAEDQPEASIDLDALADAVEDTPVTEPAQDTASVEDVAEDEPDLAAILSDEPAPAPQSVAAKLERIRAVVGRKAVDEAPEIAPEYTEDLTAQGADLDDEDIDLNAVLEDVEEVAEETAPAAPATRVIRMKRADFEKAIEAETPTETAVEAEVAQEEEDENDIVNLDGLDDYDLDDDGLDLSQEEEAELLRELSDVTEDDDDFDADGDAENAFIVEEDEPASAPNRRAVLDQDPEQDERSLSRILSRTNEQLNEPATNRRIETINQLKAAVVATEAARRLGDKDDASDAAQDYRDDLDKAVGKPAEDVAPARPRRPQASAERRTERPRPSPLKLVASQRVDEVKPAAEAEAVTETVRPRRVAAEAPQAPVAGQGFATFAREAGATELHELLEAAAAYTSYVEGLEDFSRPQIMKKVREVLTPDHFNREDGLRSFGTLLRQGRINKVRNGRFQVSEQTRFRPESRSA
jgi:hypothetical protein